MAGPEDLCDSTNKRMREGRAECLLRLKELSECCNESHCLGRQGFSGESGGCKASSLFSGGGEEEEEGQRPLNKHKNSSSCC